MLIFVYVVNPLVAFVLRQVRRIPDGAILPSRSLVATYLLLLAVVATVLAFLVPKLARELQTLAVNLRVRSEATGHHDRISSPATSRPCRFPSRIR